MTLQYILVDRRPMPCPDMKAWGAWLQSSGEERRVALDDVREFHISTVFLGLDHNFAPGGAPLLFETLVTGGEDATGIMMRRYSTWKEAEKGHRQIVHELREKT